MSGDLHKKVLEWLENHGGPLELDVAERFQRRGFDVSQGVHWIDRNSGKLRESDLLAFQQQVGVRGVTFTVATTFLVECKRSSSRPWVALVGAASDSEAPASVYGWVACRLARKHLLDRVALVYDRMPSIYPERATAYSLTEAKLGKKVQGKETSLAYTAISQVLDATEERFQRIEEANEPNRAHLLFPIVVCDGNLFEYSLGPDGPRLRQVGEITVVLTDRALGKGHARVRIVTRGGLDDFLEGAKAMAGWIGDLAFDIADELSENAESSNQPDPADQEARLSLPRSGR